MSVVVSWSSLELVSVRIRTDSVLQRENKRTWAPGSCGVGSHGHFSQRTRSQQFRDDPLGADSIFCSEGTNAAAARHDGSNRLRL